MNRLFGKYLQKQEKAGVMSDTRDAAAWFKRVVRREGKISNINRVTDGFDPVTKLKPGMLITYYYSPKGMKFLPFWDRHPLVLVKEITRDGWIGINLHYVHPNIRKKVLNGGDAGQNITKRYLASYVQGRPINIPKDYWDIAIQLPYENFEKTSAIKVWNKGKK